MCGLGTTCCMYGCCPSGSTCNDVGACIETITTTNSAGQTTTTTSTIVPAQTSLPGSAPTSTPSTVKPVTTVITTSDITITVTIPTILTTPLVETTEGVTLTFEPPPPPPPPSTQPTTAIVSGTPVVIVGTYTIPEPPHVTNPTTITTDGVTITFEPSPPPSVQPTTTTISGTPVVIVGPYTIPEPPHVTNPTTVITDGVTITFEPSPPPSVQPTTTTISGTPVIIVGPYTIPEPPHVTNPTTITTDGVTMTFEPPSPSAQPTTTTVSGTPVVIIGPYTIPEPAHITTPTTVTTDGVTLTFEPPSTTSTPSSKSGATTSSTGTVLPTFSTWPPFTIIPVTTTVSGPQPTSTGTVVPCDLWFFDICLVWSSLHVSIFGWYIPLPAGIYPPGPPPDMKFPPGISIEGTLPPWPEITIGNDHLPTYSSEPTSCQTETATLCGTTTSYAVSTSGTVTSTTSSQIASTCQTVAGCSVSDENTSAKTTASATCSSTSTVTDVWVSCATGATSAPGSCTTTSTSLVSGCGVTASTMMCTRTTTITGTATGTALPGPNNDVCTVYTTETYVVYPMDSTDSSQTAAIASLLGTMATAADIFTLTATGIGIIYWQLPLSPDQASSLAQNSNVRSVFIPCLDSCYDPSIELVMQSNSPDTLVFVDQFGTGPSSPNNNPLSWYRSNYVFDDSAGSGIPVYMIDSGVDTTHPEFTTGFTEGPLNGAGPVNDRLRFITVGSTLGTTPGTDIRGHGTSMMSQITGWSLGISKLVEPICVQMDILGGATQFIKALNAVLDDVDQKGYQQAVLSMSIFYPDYIFNAGTDYAGTAVQVALLLKALVAKGVLPVAGSGNDGKSTIAGVPAGLGANNPPELNLGALTYVPEMLVVGGVNSAGALYPRTNTYAQFGLPHIYAPGDSVRTAWKPYRSSSGTSIATAQTAGLAAYLLGLAKANGPNHLSEDISTPAKLKSYMMELSWERVAGYPAIYNGLSPVDAGSLLTGPSCPLVQRDIPEGELPSMAPCPTTNTTSTVSTTSASTFATSTITNTSLPPLPRLSTTTTPPITTVQPIVTSPGSSCASTTTTTLCEVPQEPCFPSAVCQSWVATTTTSVAPPTTTSAAPSPTASWILSIYNAACSDMNSNADFDYYTLEGFEKQELNEQCIPLQGALPLISDTTASCEWFTNGGLTSAKSCSSGTFTSPTSFNIHNGFCTIYADANCSGESNGIDSSLYTGCTDITSDLFMPSTWGSMQCFAYRA